MKNYCILRLGSTVLFSLSAAVTWADQDDNIRLFNNQTKFNQQQQEQQLVEQADFLGDGKGSYLNIDGQHYLVQDTEADLTKAIFISINRKQWQDVQRFVARYKQLPIHAEVVVLFAEGAIARGTGDIAEAEQKFAAMYALDPEFTRGTLEYARVLFENQKNKEAQALFLTLRQNVPPNLQQPIDMYLKAIDLRQKMRGSLAVGIAYNDNINKKDGGSNCVYMDYNGIPICIRQTAEQSISDTGLNINASIDKTWQLTGHHNLFAKGLWYGTQYRHQHNYTEHTLDFTAGYKYADYNTELTLAPSFEKYFDGGKTLYNAVGAKLEHTYTLNPKTQFNTQLEYQHNRFIDDRIAQSNNGNQYSAYLTVSRQLTDSLIAFGGLNAAKKDVKDKAESFNQIGGRLGFYQVFPDSSNLSVLSMYRQTHYDEKNAWLGDEPSKNKEQLYFITYSMPQHNFLGFYPSLNYRYSRQKSNNQWFYGYSGNEWSFKLQKNF